MIFWVANNSSFDNTCSNFLYVSLDNLNITIPYKNFVESFNGIFSNPNMDEKSYYLATANKLKMAGFDGFKDWIIKLMNEFSNHSYLDDRGKEVYYDNLVFLTDDQNQRHCIQNIFKNFGFVIKELKNTNANIINSLF